MFVALDIGGTHMRVAAVRSLGQMRLSQRNVRVLKTWNRYGEDVGALADAIRTLAPGRVRGVGVSVAGKVNRERGTIAHSPNIARWDGKPLAADLQKTFGCPVTIENDAVSAAIGEAVYGTAKGDFYFLVWGTGIGGASVVRMGKRFIVLSSEPGQQVIPMDGRAVVLEQWSGGVGVKKRFRKHPEQLAAKEWVSVLQGLERGVANVLTIRPVPTVVFGGGMSLHYPNRIRELRRALQRTHVSHPLSRLPAFRVTTLGDFAGLYGAFARLKLGKRLLIL